MTLTNPVRSSFVFLRDTLLAPMRGVLVFASLAVPLVSGCGPLEQDTSHTTEQLGISKSAETSAVVIYADGNYNGASQTLAPGAYDMSSLAIGNDSLSSLTIPAGWRVLLYSDGNYQGTVKTFTASTGWVGDDFNDKTSSIVVQSPSSAVIIYADGSYGGASQWLGPGNYDIGALGIGNDALSSLKVPSGWTVQLYADGGFQGTVKTFTSDTGWVGDDFNDLTSSIRVIPPASPYPAQQTAGITLAATSDVETLKYELASNPTVISELASLANDLGYGWCGGTRSPYVGQDFDVSRTVDGNYIMQAHYNSSDPYASGYWADSRLRITLSNFKLLIDPSTFAYGPPLTTSLDPIAVAQSYAINPNSTPATLAVQLTDQHTDSYTHTTNYSFTEGIKISIKNKAEVPLFGSSEVTTEFSFSATQGWSDATTTSNVTGITSTYTTPVPATSKKLVTMLGFRTSSQVNYAGLAYLSFNITFDGFLRYGGNARVDHPSDRPFVTTTFGNDNMSGLQDVLDKYDHRNISGYSQWDWNWVNSFDGNAPNLMNAFRQEIASQISGRFSGVRGTYTEITEGAVQPL